VRFRLLRAADFQHLVPTGNPSIVDWRLPTRKQVHKFQCKGFDTLFVLVGWSLRLEPNARVLNNKSLLAVQLAAHIRVEGLQWIAAGFSDLGDFIH
jgi:hypothetical protein